MPLTMAPAGRKAFICKINGKDDVRHFLGGNMIVNVKDSRIAISKSMANRIMVADS